MSVVGGFNDWNPYASPLRRRANGTRSAVVTVPAGCALRFRYLGQDGLWFADETASVCGDLGTVIEVWPSQASAGRLAGKPDLAGLAAAVLLGHFGAAGSGVARGGQAPAGVHVEQLAVSPPEPLLGCRRAAPDQLDGRGILQAATADAQALPADHQRVAAPDASRR